jgi:hypothetical protein
MDSDLELTVDVMQSFLGTRDAKGSTLDILVNAYGFDKNKAKTLVDAAWREWLEAYE